MGQTTDMLLHAGRLAVGNGHVNIDAVRHLYSNAMDYFFDSDNDNDNPFSKNTVKEVSALLDECEDLLRGVSLLQELSRKTVDQLVSYGNAVRCKL